MKGNLEKLAELGELNIKEYDRRTITIVDMHVMRRICATHIFNLRPSHLHGVDIHIRCLSGFLDHILFDMP